MKKVKLQYGKGQIQIAIPDSADVLSAAKVKILTDPAKEIRQGLAEPIGTPPLSKLAQGKDNAAIVVSDSTRPVPYSDPDGILTPIIETLQDAGVKSIKIIVAYGMHHSMDESELRRMLCPSAFQPGIEVINHVATDKSMLTSIGSTERTPNVTINSYYLNAQFKIATGLVEPHFMAGVSGGRKAICPGICGQDVTYGFHSAKILNHPKSTTLLVEGNPCHEESLKIAKMAGVDFIVNVTVDSDKKTTGVFSGDLEKAHLAAIEHLRTYTTIPLEHLYDIVVSQSGEVGINHYQCGKAAFEACCAAKENAKIILAADLSDLDPLGEPFYKQMLELMVEVGYKKFMQKILSDDWIFVHEQWGVQMWAKVFEKLIDPTNLYTCAPQLENSSPDLIPEINVASKIKRLENENDPEYAQRMLQQTIDGLIESEPDCSILVLPDGPYAIPRLK